jgi:prepilin-type N-terminal cleavage/methylation domain-containing protein
MIKTTRRSSAAFTLIELLTVVAIIGILAAIVIPSVGKARERAQRAVDLSNIKQDIQSAILYANDNKDKFPSTTATVPANTAQKWAYIVASTSDINDPYFFIAKNDIVDITAPTAIYTVLGGVKTIDTTFNGLSDLSVAFVAGGKLGDPMTTPLVFTRGLNKAGTWSPTTGVYKNDGGYIGFIGGNVSWYSNTTNALSQPSGTATTDITTTITATKTILSTTSAGDATGAGTGTL